MHVLFFSSPTWLTKFRVLHGLLDPPSFFFFLFKKIPSCEKNPYETVSSFTWIGHCFILWKCFMVRTAEKKERKGQWKNITKDSVWQACKGKKQVWYICVLIFGFFFLIPEKKKHVFMGIELLLCFFFECFELVNFSPLCGLVTCVEVLSHVFVDRRTTWILLFKGVEWSLVFWTEWKQMYMRHWSQFFIFKSTRCVQAFFLQPLFHPWIWSKMRGFLN
jgi:hypothetical protein